MAEAVIVGAGVVGLGAAMLLAKDGHQVTVLERDPAPPPESGEEAFARWERTGVNQFRLPHIFLARYREVVAAELPEILPAIEKDGGIRWNPLDEVPDEFTGGRVAGDERFETVTGRRAVVERAVARLADCTPRIDIRRGVAVRGLLLGSEARSGVPHVAGVVTTAGDDIRADLVVDCSGRRSAAPSWFEALEDSGFIYFGRHYRSKDGALPPSLGPGLQEWGSLTSLSLPADNGTWAVVLVARAADRPLLGLRDVERWEAVVRSLPTVAHWIDAAPIEDRVVTMAKIEDRRRSLTPEGSPIATGIVAVADAWACTNPSLGRGASIGMLHALALRDTLREVGLDRPAQLSDAFAAATAAAVDPWYEATVAFDRHRLAEMEAFALGRPYEPGDAAYGFTKAMRAAAMQDPDVLRAFLSIVGVLELPEDAIKRPGVLDKVIELGGAWRDERPFGPTREELVAMATA